MVVLECSYDPVVVHFLANFAICNRTAVLDCQISGHYTKGGYTTPPMSRETPPGDAATPDLSPWFSIPCSYPGMFLSKPARYWLPNVCRSRILCSGNRKTSKPGSASRNPAALGCKTILSRAETGAALNRSTTT